MPSPIRPGVNPISPVSNSSGAPTPSAATEPAGGSTTSAAAPTAAPITPSPVTTAPTTATATAVSPPAAGPAAAAGRDIFNRKPVPLKPQPNLPFATEAGKIGEAKVIIASDGTLGLGSVPTSLAEQVRSVRVAMSQAPDNQPLAGVNDVQTVKLVATSASRLFEASLKKPKNDGEALELRAARAGALGLMEAAARRAGQLGDVAARDALTLGLVFNIQKEPYRPLKDFAFESSLARAAKGELSKTKAAESELYPSKPPYEKWLKDGKISIVHYTDNNGSPREDNVQIYVDRGFVRTDNADGSTSLTRKAEGRKPQIEVTIPPAPNGTPPSLFERMGDESVDVIIYAGHAGYGKRVEDALSKGVSGTGEGKLVVLLQCYGYGSIESVNRTFPDTHLVSTREASDDNYDFSLVDNLVRGIDRRATYQDIAETNSKEFNAWLSTATPALPGEEGLSESDLQSYKDHPVEKHFFFPNSREVMLEKLDRDRDGVHDNADTLFNIVYPKRVDASGGFDPLDPGAPLDGLDGAALNSAVNQLNLVPRYAVLPPNLLGTVPWHPEVFQPAGHFEGSSSDLRAFRFELDAGTNKIKVTQNSLFAHAPAEALGRMLAIEAGQFVAEKAGLDAANQSALCLSFLERIRHQEGTSNGYSYRSSPLETEVVKDRLFRQRYGLGLKLDELMTTSANPDDFVAATYDSILQKVRSTPGLEALGAARPVRATVELTVPDNLVVSGSLDPAALTQLMSRLGVSGTVDPSVHSYTLWTSPGSRAVVTMLDANNVKFYVSLGVDSEGVVRAASRIPA